LASFDDAMFALLKEIITIFNEQLRKDDELNPLGIAFCRLCKISK
jgi:hypothetical protein